MERFERRNDFEEAIRVMLDSAAAGLWTALPGIIHTFDAAQQTATVKPAVLGQFKQQDGTVKIVTMPLLLDVPVYFPNGGGHTLTFPVAADDECLVVFADRCIDNWWNSGQVQQVAEVRMHDLSDGMAFVGFRSKPRMLSNLSTSSTQLRADNGSTFIDLNAGAETVTITAPGGTTVNTTTAVIHASTSITLDSPQTTCTGKLTVEGLLTYQAGMAGSGGAGAAAAITGSIAVTGGNVTADGIDLKTHVHSGVQTGSGNTGAPQG